VKLDPELRPKNGAGCHGAMFFGPGANPTTFWIHVLERFSKVE
jgi:hypothetical protein